MKRRDVLVLPAAVLAGPAFGQPGQLATAVAGFTGGAPVREGRVKLDVAKLVDNGNVVPVKVTVDSPMSAADHVVSVGLFNDRNPLPGILTFTLGPRAGKAEVSTRIRLATTQKLAAVAKMSDGSFWSQTVDVVVVLAACIEGES